MSAGNPQRAPAASWRATLPAGFAWPPGVRAAACFTFDVDAESALLFDHPETAGHLDVMTHQAYGPRTGVPRLLRVLDRAGIRATFFVPGYTAERWPEVVRAIRDAGHEIAHHGYLHEGSRAASPEQEEARLVGGLAALDAVAGIRPSGYRAPNWEVSYALPELLVRHGFRYDSSLMDADHPYRLQAASETTDSLVELPGHWALDDWEAYNYLPGLTGSGVIGRPRDVVGRWQDELDALVDEGALWMLTNHPFVSGRASRAAALADLMAHARSIPGLWIATADEIARHVETLPLEPIHHVAPSIPA